MKQSIETYTDENCTKIIVGNSNLSEKDMTGNIAAMRTARAAERQNELYEKEIKELHRNGTIAKWAAIVSAIMSALSVVISVMSNL